MTLLVYVTFPQDGVLRRPDGASPASSPAPHGLEAARLLARELVDARLAAGVNILPGATSVYRWQDALCEAPEIVLLAQVSRAAFPAFCAHVRARHPHDVPCILALKPEDGHPAFLRWISENSPPPAPHLQPQ
ncbi:divalent-cation tolerance protein CutA [uncultured Desulfovibrio sp.]|uniref:divalent-cation tolerance protein CutA n=1 Tax=uncultured Desulfovibrio sp. TaxID=167968 RepID=UPI00262F1556|nr:divalent-cation tolerance protein CutA [uncultured Desulfovibrio sp.]